MTGFEGFGLWSIVGTIATVVGGLVTPANIESYVSLNVDPWDSNETFDFREQMGMFGIQTDLGDHVRLFAEHQSSPRQGNDHPGLNHAGVKFLAPISPETTLYSGLSLNSPIDTNKVHVDAPLISLGLEDGDEDLKIFVEYLADISKIEKGRLSIGLKLYFR